MLMLITKHKSEKNVNFHNLGSTIGSNPVIFVKAIKKTPHRHCLDLSVKTL